MPRVYGAVYQPYSYEELAAPLREATVAHQNTLKDFDDNMLVVDSLRQRALDEPDSQWSKRILDYADLLENYAYDLARNGLTRTTGINLLNMKRGFGTTVSPVMMAMLREKELQTIRDKATGTRTVFSQMPTIDEIIANPNIGLNAYSGEDIYKTAKEAAEAMSERNIELINPININDYIYMYGKNKGFTNDEIAKILYQDPGFAELFRYIKDLYGYIDDTGLTEALKNRLNNEVMAGALAGFTADRDRHYQNRKDDPLYLLNLNRQINSGYIPWDPTNRPVADIQYIRSYDVKELNENLDFINKFTNDKNIVKSVTQNPNNGQFIYDISDNYVLTIIDGLNNKLTNQSLPIGGSVTGYIQTAPVYDRNELAKNLAKRFGITQDDDIKSAKEKINNYLNGNISYEDKADATQNVAMNIDIQDIDLDNFWGKYNSTTGYISNVIWDDKNQRYIDGNERVKFEDYRPISIELSNRGTVVRVRNKKTNQDLYVRYFDYVASNNATLNYRISVDLQRAWNLEISNQYDYYKNNILNFVKNIDNEVFLNMTGYNKSDIILSVLNANSRIDSKYNAVNIVLNALYKYYASMIQFIGLELQKNPYDQEYINSYREITTLMNQLELKGKYLDSIMQNIIDIHSGINEGLVRNVFLTNTSQDLQYKNRLSNND